MFQRIYWLGWLLLGITAGALAGCGRLQAQPTPTPSPTATVTPTATPSPTATPTSTPSPTPAAQAADVNAWETYSDAAKGMALRYPTGWTTSPYLFFQAFTSNETLLSNPTAVAEGGVALVFAAPVQDLPGDNPLEVLDNLIGQFGPAGQTAGRSVQPPTLREVQTWPAALTALTAPTDDGESILMVVGVVMAQPNGVVLVGVTPEGSAGEYRPIFEAMFQSISLSAPSTPTRSPDEAPQSAAHLQYGAAITATLSTGARDVWPFRSAAGDAFKLSLAPIDNAFDAAIDVLDTAGASLIGGAVDQSFGGETIPYVIAPVSGTYTVSVAAVGGGSGAYVLRLDLLPQVAAGQTITSAVTAGSETALALRGPAGTVVDLLVEEISGDLDVAINVLDVGGVSLVGGEVDRTAAVEEIRGVQLPENGSAIIVARGYAATAGQFRVRVMAARP